MSYRLQKNEPVQDGIKRIAREQIEKALGEINNEEINPHETVHQVRKRCKKIRGLIRLVRPQFEKTYKKENVFYRDESRELSYVRDAQSIIETFDKLKERFQDDVDLRTLKPIRDELLKRREKVTQDKVKIEKKLVQFEKQMEKGKERVDKWIIDKEGFGAVEGGLKKTYKRGVNSMKDAYEEQTTEAFHEWRKRVKYHWYHMRLLTPLWQEVLKKRRNEVHLLSDYLGDEHDLAVLRETILKNPERFANEETIGIFMGLIDQRRTELKSEAELLGKKIFCEKPKNFTGRFKCYWDVWRGKEVDVEQQMEV